MKRRLAMEECFDDEDDGDDSEWMEGSGSATRDSSTKYSSAADQSSGQHVKPAPDTAGLPHQRRTSAWLT